METDQDESKKIKEEKIEPTNGTETTENPSTTSKDASQIDQNDQRKLLAAEINERDIKAAAASALAAAAVKAKVRKNIQFVFIDRQMIIFNTNTTVFGIDRRAKNQICCSSSRRITN